MPFVRVVHLQLQPGTAEEVIASARRDLEAEQPVPGLLSLHGLRNLQDPDAGMLVSFFEDRESMEANTAQLQADLGALQRFLVSPPEVSVHEVVVEKRAAGSGL